MSRSRAWRTACAALLLVLAAALAVCSIGGDDSTKKGTVEVVVTDRATGEPAAEVEAQRASRIKTHIDTSDVVRLLPPQIVLDGDVAQQRKGTPGHALLEWWQAFQFHDTRTVRALTSEATRTAIGAHSLATVVLKSGLPGIKILGVTVNGDTALIQAALLNFNPPKHGAPPPREPTGSQPVTITMKSEAGGWRFAQTDFLVPKVKNLERRP